MIVKREIKIYDFGDSNDKELVERLLEGLIQKENLVPMIGTGFSSGLRTRNGSIPTVAELTEEMIDIMCIIDGGDKEELKDVILTDLADEFWKMVSISKNKAYKNRFIEYVENNFTRVFDVDQPRREFLNSYWKTIFTLNYDDTIENVLETNILIPYDKINRINSKGCLIKLHGDAKKYALTGDDKYCVLGNKQYINLIKDERNEDIVKNLEDAFFSKSIMFVGCSLNQELDVLYSSGISLEEKCRSNKEHHMIYLSYGDSEVENVLKYKKYGITDIIKVNEETIHELYGLVHSISEKNEMLREKDLLKDFTDISFEYLDTRNDENLEYLFYNDKVCMNKGKIKLPGFFVERTCGHLVEEEVLTGKHTLNVIYGASFSGKTYVMLQLLKNLTSKKIYYFPSSLTLSQEIISEIIEKKDAVILIDDKVISFEQCRNTIFPQLERIKENRLKIILAINKDDSEFYKYYLNHKDEFQNSIRLFELENKFDDEERACFNDHIGDISLSNYEKNDTILDYLFKADSVILKKRHKSILPEINFLDKKNEKQVRALIVIGTRGALTSREAIDLQIDDVLYEMTTAFQITVQKDYLSGVEKSGEVYPGFKFVLNSTFWVVKCLSSFAKYPQNHVIIAKAYHNIIDAYTNTDERKMNEKIKEYYMLDKIQLLFSDVVNKGTIILPYFVYEELHTSLKNNFQFLHQEAKCELRRARRGKKETEKNEILELAYRNISRALSLAEKVSYSNIEYTRAHMKVTKALILTNYVFGGNDEKISEVINMYYDVFIENSILCPQLEKDEMKDVKAFLADRWNNDNVWTKDVKQKFEELYTYFFVMRKM